MTSYLPWIFSTGGKIRARPLVSEGVAYFGTDSGEMYAAPIGSRQESWRFDTGDMIVSTPVLDSGVLYFGSGGGYFYALDAASGEMLWRFEAGGAILTSAAHADGIILFGSQAGTFHALDAGSGRELWSVPARGAVSSTPAVSGNMVSFSDRQGSAFVLGVSTGEIAYASYQPRASTATAISGDLMIFGSATRMLAMEISSGRRAWEFPVYHEGISDPVIAGGTVYFGAGNYFYALDAASGMPKWELVTGSTLKGTAAVHEGTIFFTTHRKGIIAVDLGTGRQWWSFDAGTEELSPPLAAGNWLLTGSSDGNLYGYRLEAAEPRSGPVPRTGSGGMERSGSGKAGAAPLPPQPPHLGYHVRGRVYSNAQAAWHLYPLILLSFNIFQYYWFFRNWKYFNVMGIRSVRPGVRLLGLVSPVLYPALALAAGGMTSAIAGVEMDQPFFDILLGGTVMCYVLSLYLMYDQFKTIRNTAREQGVRSFPLFIVVSAYFSLQNLPPFIGINVLGGFEGVPGPGAAMALLAICVASFLLSIFVLTLVQKAINRIWQQRFPRVPVRREFTSGERVLMGVFVALLLMLGLLLPLLIMLVSA